MSEMITKEATDRMIPVLEKIKNLKSGYGRETAELLIVKAKEGVDPTDTLLKYREVISGGELGLFMNVIACAINPMKKKND